MARQVGQLRIRKLLELLIACTLCLQLSLLHTKVGQDEETVPIFMSMGSINKSRAASSTETKAEKSSRSLKQSAPHTDHLPKWMQSYIQWHRESLEKFPGDELFSNPEAPQILLRYCGICGGLHDRLGQLPWDLYLANQTKRLLFIAWHRPKSLESFLLPNELNWTLPTTKTFEDNKRVRKHTRLFAGYNANDNPEEEADFWTTVLDFAITRATTGEYANVKVLRHRFFGHLHEEVLEQRLRKVGETDMIHWTSSFGHLFHAFFRPSTRVQQEVDAVYRDLALQKQQYSAVHCRVRHPKATPIKKNVKGEDGKPADLSGLPWSGETRDFAISVATKSFKCAQSLLQHANEEPLYFFADSNDLVRFMAHELTDPKFRTANATLLQQQSVNAAALETVKSLHVVARSTQHPNAHIDRQLGMPLADYIGTFVDLYLAIHARCVTYGIGFFALFAAKISGTSCKLSYQKEQWGEEKKKEVAPVCNEET